MTGNKIKAFPSRVEHGRIIKPTQARRFVAERTQKHLIKTNLFTLEIVLARGDVIDTKEDGSIVLNERWPITVTELHSPGPTVA